VESIAGIVLTGVAAFAATNVDDLFLLVAFFGDRSFRPRHVLAGQFAGIAALYGASAAAALVALVFPPEWLSLLGLVPIALGAKQLRGRAEQKAELPASSGILGVAAVTVANGGDNIGVYAPLFANSTAYSVALTGLVFAAMTALWCYAAYRLVSHPGLGAAIRRSGSRAVPFVLIALGVWILLRD
jgi:cadmium resistance protein CadD (predicted permease)